MHNIKDHVVRTHEMMASEADLEILNWLSPREYGLQQSDYLRRRQPGTGQWLLDSEQYQSWIATASQTLFCPGNPGTGKTILTSIVIEDLEQRFPEGAAVCYIYCSFNRKEEQTIEDLVLNLLKQLSRHKIPLPAAIKDMRRQYAHGTTPTTKKAVEALGVVAAEYSRVFLVVDALDEYETLESSKDEFLTMLFSLQTKARVNLFVTSRFIPSITKQFSHTPRLEVQATQEDIGSYLRARLSQLGQWIAERPDLGEEIVTKLTRAVNGV